MKVERSEPAAEERFNSTWSMRFKERSHLHNIKMQDKIAVLGAGRWHGG